ncbi:hypothetical protein [Pelagovum pacificum]|uniref:Uncharacterized protein n=1 Tax=Pelagovum pacificum TaxID=2588711 RepID=A0A5C5GE22_9RHOB|nr:hypothetical protein [Pelagovum pacificum]QQA43922.1 hypothetical protein I8N54_04910 [Pelagovum pacificum]TNY32948.1 hypothetical protein FHY64_06630 [Pelagovum pacificum]
MRRSIEELLQRIPPKSGNGGRYQSPTNVFKDVPEPPKTQLDKTSANARVIIDDDAVERLAKKERLKAARQARDAAKKNED